MPAFDAKGRPAEVMRFEPSSGVPIYLLPIETFPGHVNNVYLLLADGEETLVDVGSQLPSTAAGLDARFEELRERFGESVTIDDVRRVVITHAHIDHFGNVHRFADRGVEVCVHELDARVLENFEERIILAAKDVGVFLRRAGVPGPLRAELTTMYMASKEVFRSVGVGRRLRHGDALPGELVVHHAPGHCPGLVCVQVGDVLLTSDHLLARITPNQSPESITPFTGLENYLRSLEKVAKLPDVRLALGGHEAPIDDPVGRITETMHHHRRRLDRVLEVCRDRPQTLAEVSDALFGDQQGYGKLLAYSEAGAHVEYLHLHGALGIANLEDVRTSDAPVYRYRTR